MSETIPLPWWREDLNEDVWPLYEDFRVFLRYMWKRLRLPHPTPIQYDIAYWLQHGPRRQITEAFRGVGKSWITACFVLWLLMRDPQVRILVVSASKDRSDDFTTFCLRLIEETPILQFLAPRPGQRCSRESFDVGPAEADQTPSLRSRGVFGQLTGGRADYIIPDDVEVPKTSETAGMRAKLAERVKEFDAVLKPGGHIKYLGTPQTEESLYNLLPERGYEIRVWTSEYPDRQAMEAYGERLAPYIRDAVLDDETLVGKPTDPKRFHATDLLERKASYGRTGYALQFMLDTRLSDADRYPLKLADLLVDHCDPELAPEKLIWARDPRLIQGNLPNVGFNGDHFYAPMDYGRAPEGHVARHAYEGCVMAIDPAGRGKDETAYSVIKMLNGQLFKVGAGGFRDGYSDATLIALCEIAKKHKVNEIIVEPNFGDGMFTALLHPHLQRIYPCTCEETKRSVAQKEKRIIDTLEPVMNQHRLVIDPALIEEDFRSTEHLPPEDAKGYRLMYQLSHITRDRGSLPHDDRLDAMAAAVGYWVEQMGADIDRKVQQHQDDLLTKQLEEFREHVFGHTEPGSTWM